MKKKQWKPDINYALWFLGMLLFLLFMADWYCRMVYGGNFLYVMLGGNEISEEERDYLRERGILIYGETLDSFPAQVYDSSLQEQNGFATDLMEQLSWESGAQMALHPLEWPEVFQKLESGEVDIIQVTYSEERKENFYLTVPIYRNRGVVFLQNKGDEVRAISELGNRRLAGIKEDYALSVLKEICPELQITECSNIEECAEQLRKQQVDGIVADEQNLMYYIQAEKLFQDYYMVEESVYEGDVVFAVRKSDEKLGRILDKAIYKLRNQDVLEKIQKKWFLTSILQDALPARKLYIWRTGLCGGIACMYIWLFWYIHMRTRRLVELRTEELACERRRLQVLLDSIPQYVLEMSGHGDILKGNYRVEAALSAEELPFCDSRERKLKDPRIFEILRKIQKEGHAAEEVETEERWYRFMGNHIQGQEEEGHIILVAEDITWSRMQEQKSIQNEKMIAVGHLASGVAHELKNPLEIICNYCYAFKNGLLRSEGEIKDLVEVIEEEAKSANGTVENLLSFARIAPKNVSRTNLKEVMEMILRLQESVFQKKKVEVGFFCEDALFVRCNPENIKQIMINLLTNAAEAMDPEKENNRITVTAVREANRVKMEIQDTGKGISEKEINNIFNPFYTTKDFGTGLGLYLVYQQVHEIGGEIQVFSREGEGTLFRIWLLLNQETSGGREK